MKVACWSDKVQFLFQGSLAAHQCSADEILSFIRASKAPVKVSVRHAAVEIEHLDVNAAGTIKKVNLDAPPDECSASENSAPATEEVQVTMLPAALGIPLLIDLLKSTSPSTVNTAFSRLEDARSLNSTFQN
jgi:hypothetical protein